MDLESLNFSELRDAEIVASMRKCNYEKFKTLVRMHLSFELDLNTDEFDIPCHEIVYEDRGKLKKWNRLSKKHKHGVVAAALATGSAGCAYVGGGQKSSSGNVSPTESLNQKIDSGFLFHLQELKEFLMLEKNVQQEGIFRKTGSTSRQNELRNQMQNDKPLDLEASGYSAHDCATVFKGYLAELNEPLLTDAHYSAHLQIAPLCMGINSHTDDKLNQEKSATVHSAERVKKELHVLNSIQLLLLLLPDENRQLLQNIIDMLHAVARHHSINKMGPDNLATLFAPHLICPRNIPPEALHYLAKKMSSIIAYMIIRGQDIFSVPSKLATDIRAYFLERKRKKTMSPEMTLDDSISDISTVNTVYTFVDREKTAAAHNTNTTDTELAQLYAHIQSLPESSKKRRLIKQFNKQNGQGTPLQLQAMNRVKNSETSRSAKSLSDSIKKHIFYKGIMSRTPKRQPISEAVLEESIMTPRSRKPVMVLTATTSSTEQNQTINRNSEEEIEDNDHVDNGNDNEDNNDSIMCMDALNPIPLDLRNTTVPPQPEIINEDATSLGGFSDIFKHRQLLQATQSSVGQCSNALGLSSDSDSQTNSKSNERKDLNKQQYSVTSGDALTDDFKEYLLTRSVLTAPPEDTSFTSHSDDFDSSHEIDENQLSSSLLYCLDGNRPVPPNDFNTTTTDAYNENDDDTNDTTHTNANSNRQILATFKTTATSSSASNSTRSCNGTINSGRRYSSNSCSSRHIPLVTTNRLANNPFVILNNARKRAANQDLDKISSTLFNSHVESATPPTYPTGLNTLRTATVRQLNSPTNKHNTIGSLATNSNSFLNKENCEKNENYVVTKKLLISEYPGETSF